MTMKKDGRSRNERIKKWIREQKEFGKQFKIDPRATKDHIKMRLSGWDNIAGLNKKAIKNLGYKNSATMRIKKYLPERNDFFVVWQKSKGVAW